MTTFRQISRFDSIAEARAHRDRIGERADRAFRRLLLGQVASPAYARRLAAQLEEADADLEHAIYDAEARGHGPPHGPAPDGRSEARPPARTARRSCGPALSWVDHAVQQDQRGRLQLGHGGRRFDDRPLDEGHVAGAQPLDGCAAGAAAGVGVDGERLGGHGTVNVSARGDQARAARAWR